MKRYNDLLQFISKNYNGFVFIALFYSLWLVFKYISTYDPELHSFSGRMIGQATLQGYDIQQRIAVFYKSGLLLFSGLILFSIAAWRIDVFLGNFLKSTEIQIINYSSLTGIILYFFLFWHSPVKGSLELIYTIHKIVFVTFLLKKTIFRSINNASSITTPFYAIAFVCGFSLLFLLNEIAVLFNLFPKADLHYTLFVSVLVLFIFTVLKLKQKNKSESVYEIDRIAYILLPIAFLPMLSVIKDELYMILNGHKIYYFSPRKLYLAGLCFLFSIVAWRYRAFNKNRDVKSAVRLVGQRYFPLLISGLILFAFYAPTIEASTEMFESGNYILPLMEFKKFGVLPIVEKFNAHLLSELFFGAIYALLNGLKGHEVFIYNFFFTLLWALLAYWFLYKFLHNPYKALFIILLFPIAESLLSEYHITALLAIFVLHKNIEQKSSFKNYILLLLCITFLILWRIDIGYPAILATAGTLFIYWANQKKFVFNAALLIKAIFVYAALTVFIVLSLALYRHLNIFTSIYSTLNYLSSAQSYGYISLGDISLPSIAMQYFVFPLVLMLVFCVFLVVFKRSTTSRSQRFIYTSLIFLSLYYFINFQRGIVAHTLTGGPDIWLSPFLFFILAASIYLFLYKKQAATKFILFIILACLLVLNYKYPTTNAQENVYSKIISKVEQFPRIDPHENITRCVNDMQYENSKFGSFKKLITEHLTEKQTFIDFSNTPMLYYLTEKISPSHFYQNPLTLHNDYLQDTFIAGLKTYDAPLLVFSHFPETWWDNAIGVPNTIRHYRMAEYFYMNYEPFAMIDSLCIWKRKNFKLTNNKRIVYTYTLPKDSLSSGTIISGTIANSENKNYVFELNSGKHIKSNEAAPLIMIHPDSETKKVSSFFNEVNHNIYYILNSATKEFSFRVENTAKKIQSLQVSEVEYLPEFYSSQPKNNDIKELPYIWGTYDKTVHHAPALTELLHAPEIVQDNYSHYFFFPTGIDKTSGNTVLISLRCNNEQPETIELYYGDNKTGYKGSYTFSIPPGKGIREFAVRTSAQYNWYDTDIDYIALNKKGATIITLEEIKLLKGN